MGGFQGSKGISQDVPIDFFLEISNYTRYICYSGYGLDIKEPIPR